jgi:hypothetical protein
MIKTAYVYQALIALRNNMKNWHWGFVLPAIYQTNQAQPERTTPIN